MKVRLGITAPLFLASADRAALAWPRFLERNFGVAQRFTHGIWLESPQALDAPAAGGRVSLEDGGRSSLHGDWSEGSLASAGSTVMLRRNPAVVASQAPDRRSATMGWVEQRLEAANLPVPPRLALVVDTSRGMDSEVGAVADALRAVPEGTDLALFLARDGVQKVEAGSRGAGSVDSVLREVRTQGGQDVVPALVEAWEWASAQPGSRILWVQGPQPVLLASTDSLRQRFERRTDLASPRLHVVATRPGPNRVMEKLDGLDAVVEVPRLGGLADDVRRFLSTLGGREPAWTAVRLRHDGVPARGAVAEGTPSHLTRLWAAGEVRRLWLARRVDEAIALAGAHQLVTPVSGAVVLETKQQFEQAGLKSVDPSTVPLVPEPGAPLLFLVGLILMFGRRAKVKWLTAPAPRVRA